MSLSIYTGILIPSAGPERGLLRRVNNIFKLHNISIERHAYEMAISCPRIEINCDMGEGFGKWRMVSQTYTTGKMPSVDKWTLAHSGVLCGLRYRGPMKT